jgi:hypothetical protein
MPKVHEPLNDGCGLIFWYRTSMLIAVFRKLENSRWLPWVSISPFVIAPIAMMISGEMWRGLGILAFFGSMPAGVLLGGLVSRVCNRHIPKYYEELGHRFSAFSMGFGFLFLPPLVGTWANANMGTEIGLETLKAHFIWACVGGGLFFFVSPTATK